MGGIGGGEQIGGGMMARLRQGIQRPQFQQAMAGMGAQMMGLDPALGQMAAQGMKQRRLNQGFAQGIQLIQRQQIDPRQFVPRGGMGGAFQVPQRLPMGVEGMGGGGWTDPRLLAMRRSNPTY